MAREQRVRDGKGKFCSMNCCNAWQKGEGEKTRGKEFAIKFWNKTANRYDVHWRDAEGKICASTYAKWKLEMLGVSIPDGHVAGYKDGNPKNILDDNLEVRTFSSVIHEKVMPFVVGVPKSEEAKKNMSISGHKKTLTDEHKRNIGIAERGDKNNFWIDGRSYIDYPPEFNIDLRRRVRQRDENHCRACGMDVKHSHGDVHHIDGNKQHSDINNLILLCDACHKTVHMKGRTSNSFLQLLQSLLVSVPK